MDSAPNPVCSVWYHKTSAWATIALPDSSAWSRDCPPVLVVSVSESIRAWMCLILPLCCIYPSLTGYLWFCPCFTLLPVCFNLIVCSIQLDVSAPSSQTPYWCPLPYLDTLSHCLPPLASHITMCALIASSTNSIQPNQPILTQSNSPPDSLVIYILYTRAEIQQHWFGTLRIVEGVTKQMVQHKCKLISRELVRNGDSARVIESEEITVKWGVDSSMTPASRQTQSIDDEMPRHSLWTTSIQVLELVELEAAGRQTDV